MTEDRLITLAPDQRAGFDWLDAPYLKKVAAAIEAVRVDGARFVGGCVRDSLMGAVPKDFDLATPLPPADVMAALKAAGLRVAPTGLDHGTVTAIVDHQGVEITTLRADVSTDGRRASVAFTDDWRVDARRRDFTINAIYLTPSGDVYDPVGGLADIKTRRVRFIGDAQHRLHEDYLRILRFFRFTARFSETVDAGGLAACASCKDGMAQLSAERIGAEMMAILALPRAPWVIGLMHDAGILKEVWPAAPNLEALERLKEIAPEVSAPVVLGALYGAEGEGIGARLRLSNAEKAVRTNALKAAAQITSGLEEAAVKSLLYRFGRDIFCDGAALSFAIGSSATRSCANGAIDRADYARLSKIAGHWPIPVFPLTGRHVVAGGVAAGPAVAKILQAAESQWIGEGFPDEARARAILAALIAAAS